MLPLLIQKTYFSNHGSIFVIFFQQSIKPNLYNKLKFVALRLNFWECNKRKKFNLHWYRFLIKKD
jgi:hypothetical protein